MEYEYLYKVIVVGDSGVGKTSLMNCYLDNRSATRTPAPTIGVDFGVKTGVISKGKRIKLHMWDAGGQDNFRPVLESYYRGVAAAVIVFDLTRPLSLESIEYWLSEVSRHDSIDAGAPLLIVGNKLDQHARRRVSRGEAERLAANAGALYTETTANESSCLDAAMSALVDAVTEHYVEGGREAAGVKKGDVPPVRHDDPNNCCRVA